MTPQYPLGTSAGLSGTKNNTYGAWSKRNSRRISRIWRCSGANAIELLPPKTDDRLYSATTPLFLPGRSDGADVRGFKNHSFLWHGRSVVVSGMSDAIIMIWGASTGRWKNAGGSFLQFLIWMQCWFRWGIPVSSGRRMRCV